MLEILMNKNAIHSYHDITCISDISSKHHSLDRRSAIVVKKSEHLESGYSDISLIR